MGGVWENWGGIYEDMGGYGERGLDIDPQYNTDSMQAARQPQYNIFPRAVCVYTYMS